MKFSMGFFVKVLLAITPLLFFSACQQDSSGGFRCAAGSVCRGIAGNQSESSLPFSCVATAPREAPVNTIFDVTVRCEGGVPPYLTAGSSSFESQTTVSGGFRTSGAKNVNLTVYDSEGDAVTASFSTVIGSDSLACTIQIENDEYTPLVNQDLRFIFRVTGATANIPISYEFIPNVRANQSGLVYTGTNTVSTYTYRYATTGDKKPQLLIHNGNKSGLCSIEHLPVRSPDFEIDGPTVATITGTGSAADLELGFIDNGDFDGTITYDSTISYTGGLVSLDEDGDEITVTSNTSVYQVVELRVVATSTGGDRVEKTLNLFFVPTTRCRINVSGAGSGNTLLQGQEASLTVDTSIGNNEAVDILDVDPGPGGSVTSGLTNEENFISPVRVRYNSSGEKEVIILAQTRDTNALCVDASGELVSVDLTVNEPPHCEAWATPATQFSGQNVAINARVPSGAGIGPFVIESLVSEVGSGYTVGAADSNATFSAGSSGYRNINFSIGRPAPGVSFLVTASVRDQGRPLVEPFTCSTRVLSVLPSGSESCVAQFQRDGQLITSARVRDNIDVVVNANFSDWGSVSSGGSRVISSGPLGWSYFPYRAHLSYSLNNAVGASSNTTFTVSSGITSRSCTANLSLTEALKCSFVSAAPTDKTIVTNAVLPNGDNPNGQVLAVNRVRVNNGVGNVTMNYGNLSDGGGTYTFVAGSPNGAVNSEVDVNVAYTKHGIFPLARADVSDAFDTTGSYCLASANQTVHTIRSVRLYAANGDNLPPNTKCKVRVEAIHHLTGHRDLDHNGVDDRTRVWVYANLNLIDLPANNSTRVTYFRSSDVTNLAPGNTNTSAAWPLDETNTHCDLSVKAMGTGVNPGDFRVYVYAVNASGTAITPEYQLPDLLQQ